MYLSSCNKSFIEKILSKSEGAGETIEKQVASGDYKVFFTYREEDASFAYEAYGSKLPYLGFALRPGPKIDPLFADSFTKNDIGLAYCIAKKDSSSSEEELLERYGAMYASLRDMLHLSPASIKEVERAKKDMMKLSSFLENGDEEEEKVAVQYGFETGYHGLHNVFLGLYYKGKRKRISDIGSFYHDIVNQAPKAFGGEKIALSEDKFSPADFSSIEKLSLLEGYSGSVELNDEKLLDILWKLKGRDVTYDGKEIHVSDEAIKGRLILTSEGRLLTLPCDDSLVQKGSHAFTIDRKEKKIQLIDYGNEKKGAVASFIIDHLNAPFEILGNDISNKILPYMENEMEVDPVFKERHPINRPRIVFYLSYSGNMELVTETKYFLGEREIKVGEFSSFSGSQRLYQSFKGIIDSFSLPENGSTKSQEIIYKFLKADLAPLKKVATVMLSEELARNFTKAPQPFRLETKSDIDFFSPSLSLPTFTAEEADAILENYRKKRKFTYLNGRFIDMSDPNVVGFVEAADDLRIESVSEEKELPIYYLFKLISGEDETKENVLEAAGHFIKEVKDYEDTEVNLDEDLTKNLRPYQLLGVKWLATLNKMSLGGILGDEMGLGKTLEMIAFLSLHYEKGPILIVSPKSLIYNWQCEWDKWDKSAKTHVLDGGKGNREAIIRKIDPKKNDAYITSYDSLRNDIEQYKGIDFAYVILDEAQYIANAFAKKTRAAKILTARRRFALTGTPIQNSLLDLWSIFDFLMPDYLYTYKEFKDTYGGIEGGHDSENSLLMKKVAPFVLKRRKKDVLKELPPKDTSITMVALNEEQSSFYASSLIAAKNAARMGKRMQTLAELTKLREICLDPSCYYEGFNDMPAKIGLLISLIKEAIGGDHKVLVFSAFKKVLFHASSLLEEESIHSLLITGETDAKERVELSDSFNEDPDKRVMLVSLKAGGTGLNLVGADIVIVLDPWWNVAAEEQAIDRAHRIGQTRPVSVIKLIARGTIEEKMIELQEKKKILTKVVEEGEETLASLTPDDISFLLE